MANFWFTVKIKVWDHWNAQSYCSLGPDKVFVVYEMLGKMFLKEVVVPNE